jgi:PAS domain S-box-containing protein
MNIPVAADGGMSDYKRMSRDELIVAARELDAALARATAQTPEPSSPSRTLDLGDDSLAQFEQCPQPMYIFDPATLEFLQVNAAAVSLYGYSAEEFLGMKITDLWTGGGDSEVLQQIRNRPASYLYYRGLRQHRAKSGDLLEVEIVGQDVLFHGRRARVGLVMDVTEEHRAMRELRESEERYRELVELSPDAIYITRDRKIIYVNGACVRLLGASSPEELIGKKVLEITHPDFHEEIMRRAQLMKERDEPLPASVQKKLRLDGTVVDVEVMAAPFIFKGERGTQVVMRDITERKKAEEELARTNAELEKFVLVASHDLQEPLRTTANAALLLDERHGEKLVGEAKELLGYVVSGVMNMRRLINALLVFSGIGTKPAAIAATDCRAVLTDVLANLRAIIEENGAIIDCGPLPVVKADPSQLEQVFMNLISNAIKFRGNGALQIQVEARREKSDWVISVADNGIGINPAYAEKVFEIFERLDTHYPGTGVGLAICKKIVEGNNGRIWVESQEGKGAKFYFTVAAADARRRPNV